MWGVAIEGLCSAKGEGKEDLLAWSGGEEKKAEVPPPPNKKNVVFCKEEKERRVYLLPLVKNKRRDISRSGKVIGADLSNEIGEGRKRGHLPDKSLDWKKGCHLLFPGSHKIRLSKESQVVLR